MAHTNRNLQKQRQRARPKPRATLQIQCFSRSSSSSHCQPNSNRTHRIATFLPTNKSEQIRLSRRTSNGTRKSVCRSTTVPSAPLLTNTLLMQQFAQKQQRSSDIACLRDRLQRTGLQSLLERLQHLGLSHKRDSHHTLTSGIFSETSIWEGLDPFGSMIGKVAPVWPTLKASCFIQSRATNQNNDINNTNNNNRANETDVVMVAAQ